VDRPRERVRAEARRQRSARDLDALDRECVEVEGAAARIRGIVHHDPVDEHDDVVRVEPPDVHRRATAARARLLRVQARAMAQHLEHAVVASGLDLVGGDHVDAAGSRVGEGSA